MVKIALIIALLYGFAHAENDLGIACINCHNEKGIPDKGIYKRYLLTYSAPSQIEKAMFNYLKNPEANNSAMPPRFINNFGHKKPSTLNDETLKKYIKTFIKRYDIKKTLYLPTPR